MFNWIKPMIGREMIAAYQSRINNEILKREVTMLNRALARKNNSIKRLKDIIDAKQSYIEGLELVYCAPSERLGQRGKNTIYVTT